MRMSVIAAVLLASGCSPVARGAVTLLGGLLFTITALCAYVKFENGHRARGKYADRC